MKNYIFKSRWIWLGLVMVFAVYSSVNMAWGAEKTLRFQVNYPGTSYGGASMKYFAKQVEQESKGKLEVQLFFAGQILNTKEAFSALQKGMVDGLYSALIYYGGIVKEANWEWLPFTWNSPQQAIKLYLDQGLLKLMQEALAQHGLHYLVPIPMGTLGFLTDFPVDKVSDFKGHKIRGMGTQSKIIQLLGGTAVPLASAEQYTALQRGTIEGTIYPFYTIGVYKFYEVIDYVIMPGVYSPCVIDVMMNQKSWDSLSPEMKEAVTKAAFNTMHWAADQNKKWDETGLEETTKHNLKVMKLSDAELKKFREATAPLWKETAQRSELSAKAVKVLEENCTK